MENRVVQHGLRRLRHAWSSIWKRHNLTALPGGIWGGHGWGNLDWLSGPKRWVPRSPQLRAWRAVPPCPRCAPCPSLQKQRIVNCGFSSNNCRSPRAQRSLHEVDPEFPHLAVRGATLGHRGLPQGGFVFLWRRPWLSRRREAQDQVRPGDRDHPCRALPTSILSSARG